jgi:hypothetical protein
MTYSISLFASKGSRVPLCESTAQSGGERPRGERQPL